MVLHRAFAWIPGLVTLLCFLLPVTPTGGQAAERRQALVGLPATTGALLPDRAERPPSGTFLLRNVRIFDGAHILPANTVLVEEGKIAKVGSNLPLSASVPVVDGTGCTLLPGLIDAHVHSYIRAALQQELMFGVTTELDMMDPPNFSIPIQKAQKAGADDDLADIFTAGWAATCPNGHGTEGGADVPTLSRPEQAQAFVDARIAEGSNYIKIIYSTTGESIGKETMAALVKAAHRRGKMAVAHALSYQAALDAMDVGADGLAHLFADRAPEPDFGLRIARHHMFVIPTLTVLDSFNQPNGAGLTTDLNLVPYLTNYPIGNLKETIAEKYHLQMQMKLEYANAALRDLLERRVPILAGSDAPNPGTWYGASLHRELELLVHAGMKPSAALGAATSVPARVFHLGDRGRIAPGLRADLLLVQGDPTRNILDTRRIVAIWKRGKAVDRMALRDTWENAMKGSQTQNVSALISYEVQDLTPKFLKFYAAAQGASPERRWQLWQDLYGFAAVPPIPEGKVMARKLLDEAWPKYPDVLDRIRNAADGMQPSPRTTLDQVARLLALDKPLRIRVLVYVGGLENNAFTATRDGVQVVALPVEMDASQRVLVMPHEFTHAVHIVTAGLSGGWERSIAEVALQEGLAMRTAQALVPGHSDWTYTEGGQDWLAECHKHRVEILKGIEASLADSNSPTVARFTVGKGTSGQDREAYYVGWILVGALMKRGMTLAQIAHIPHDAILPIVRATVQELGGEE
ncbi:MAG TPA: amidohydrolase family protein [Chthonomonadaceae bacterium]|nr:amidohydrolase family protein [Chthonomonadaceae bacterium]